MLFKGKQNLHNTEENQIIVECSCGTHLIKITSFSDEPETFFEIWASNFYTKQKKSLHFRIWHRLKLIWYAIRGKEYRLEDFVLDKNDINELISALQEVNCNKQEVKE